MTANSGNSRWNDNEQRHGRSAAPASSRPAGRRSSIAVASTADTVTGSTKSGASTPLASEADRLGTAEFESSATAEKAVLVRLYKTTNGEGWARNANWLKEESVAHWDGVTTNDDGRVVELCLSDVRMDGQLPDELGDLPLLQKLILNNNRLWGPLPARLAELKELVHLNLSANDFTGCIPDLARLTQLQSLDLSYNRLSDAIPPLGNLTKLRILDLADNRFSDEIPPLGRLTQLKVLDLSYNDLTGDIPEISTLEYLVRLNLSRNALNGYISARLGNLVNLKSLNLSNNRLSGSIPRALVNLMNLEQGDVVRGNRFDDSLPPEIFDRRLMNERAILISLHKATRGENWEAKDQWLSDAPVGDWYGITTNANGFVESLQLQDNELSGEIPTDICELAHLRHLNLRGNQLKEKITTRNRWTRAATEP